jgi:hypothetical protein
VASRVVPLPGAAGSEPKDRHDPGGQVCDPRHDQCIPEEPMKKLIELLLCILHPVAVVLIWINLAFRTDIGFIAKLTWAIASIVPFVPFVYVLTGNDFL